VHEVGGESGSAGGAGSSNIGETGSRVGESRGDGTRGTGGRELGGGVGWDRISAGSGRGDDDVLRLGRGEKRNSILSSQSRRSSTSFRLFLVLFAGGGAVSGDRWQGPKAGDGAAGVSVGGVDARAGASDTTLAVLPRLWRRRCRRRRFPEAANFTPGTGTLQETVRT
jgi:hypothetical protein